MNAKHKQLHRLLEETLEAGLACGPTRAAVLAMARGQRARRQGLRAGLAAVVVSMGLALLLRTAGPTDREPAPATQVPPAVAPLVVKQVDDAQLLLILQDTPAALMEWPNGERTLLVVQH
jgi:hypothetical protein